MTLLTLRKTLWTLIFFALGFALGIAGSPLAYAMEAGVPVSDAGLDPAFPQDTIRPIAISLPGQSQGTCTGTLLNNRTMLTASHCLKFDQDKMDPAVQVFDIRTRAQARGLAPYKRTGQAIEDDFGIVVFDEGVFSERSFLKMDLSGQASGKLALFGTGSTSRGGFGDNSLNVGIFGDSANGGAQADTSYDGEIRISSRIYALDGDSGGPLVDLSSNAILGTVSGSQDNEKPIDMFARLGGDSDKAVFFNRLIRQGVPLPSVDCVCTKLDLQQTKVHARAIDAKWNGDVCASLQLESPDQTDFVRDCHRDR